MTTSESSSQLGDEMGLFDTMYHCRAMRKLDTKPVPQELLVKTGGRGQPSAFGFKYAIRTLDDCAGSNG